MSFLSLRAASSSLPSLLRSSLLRSQVATPTVTSVTSVQSRPFSDLPPVEEKKVPFYKRMFKGSDEVKVTDSSNEEMEEEYKDGYRRIKEFESKFTLLTAPSIEE